MLVLTQLIGGVVLVVALIAGIGYIYNTYFAERHDIKTKENGDV